MVDQDKPVIHSSIKSLDTGDKPVPYVYKTRENARVVFPDLLDLEWEEGEEFLAELENASNGQVLRKWLSADDLAALKEEKLTVRQLDKLLDLVRDHYSATQGSSGEDSASRS